MNRFPSLLTTTALLGALVATSPSSWAGNTYNMYLQPLSDLSKTYSPGDVFQFQALVDVLPGDDPIALTLGPAVAFDPKVFDKNGITITPDTSVYPPVPSVNLWNDPGVLIAFSQTAIGPDGTAASALNTIQPGVGHFKQYREPGHHLTTIPAGTYTICTYNFPLLATAPPGSINLYLPTAYGFGGNLSATDAIFGIDSGGTNNQTLAFPDGGGKFSRFTVQVGNTPSPASLLVLTIGAVPLAGFLRHRRR